MKKEIVKHTLRLLFFRKKKLKKKNQKTDTWTTERENRGVIVN